MGASHTLRSKLTATVRNNPLKKGTSNRRVTVLDDTAGGLAHTYHATKGHRYYRHPHAQVLAERMMAQMGAEAPSQ